MSTLSIDLRSLVNRLELFVEDSRWTTIKTSLLRLNEAAGSISQSWCGSWLGYHACVYYAKFEAPPPGARFSIEWGLMQLSRRGSRGNWERLNDGIVRDYIYALAGRPDVSTARRMHADGVEFFLSCKSEMCSVLQISLGARKDAYLESVLDEVSRMRVPSKGEIANALRPRGDVGSRDLAAVSECFKVPPHIDVASECEELLGSEKGCKQLITYAALITSHLDRLSKGDLVVSMSDANTETTVTELTQKKRIFIGHGRSAEWRTLKDFLSERLNLEWDEFNRESAAGISTTDRLTNMLDDACFAFIVLTAEDEQCDGRIHARMNVIHEVGLFQGRLGFKKAIVLLESGCEEFSNIYGLGQIRFLKGNIEAKFEEIRRVLEREGILRSSL